MVNSRIDSLKKYFFLHFEWVALATGLFLMAILDPFSTSETICLANRLGIEFCPGCGLGKSISLTFRGELAASLNAHPAGIISVLIILGRITSIIHRNYKYKKGVKHEEDI